MNGIGSRGAARGRDNRAAGTGEAGRHRIDLAALEQHRPAAAAEEAAVAVAQASSTLSIERARDTSGVIMPLVTPSRDLSGSLSPTKKLPGITPSNSPKPKRVSNQDRSGLGEQRLSFGSLNMPVGPLQRPCSSLQYSKSPTPRCVAAAGRCRRGRQPTRFADRTLANPQPASPTPAVDNRISSYPTPRRPSATTRLVELDAVISHRLPPSPIRTYFNSD